MCGAHAEAIGGAGALAGAGRVKAATAVSYELAGRVARITLQRPERGNAITAQMLSELQQCVERADLDPHVHVVALSGAGPGFCGGYDLVESAQEMGSSSSTGKDPGDGSPLEPAVIATNHDPRGTWDPMVDYAMMSRNVRAFMACSTVASPSSA